MIKTGILHITEHRQAVLSELHPLLVQQMPNLFIIEESVIESRRHLIEEILRQWCDEFELDFIITIGGTFSAPGPSEAEIVPEATTEILERLLPGLSETMRSQSGIQNKLSILDRGVSGIRARTLIINLPGDSHLAPIFLKAIVGVLPVVLHQLRQHPDADKDDSVLYKSPLSAVKDNRDSIVHEDQLSDASTKKAKTLSPQEFSEFIKSNKHK